eukprot:3033981-Heterocapsa_arctica.AAC.1
MSPKKRRRPALHRYGERRRVQTPRRTGKAAGKARLPQRKRFHHPVKPHGKIRARPSRRRRREARPSTSL